MTRTASLALALAAGMAFGVAFVLSCGGDNRSAADAGCSCPASEPPLAGRFITQSGARTIPGGMVGEAGATCPAGAQLLSGSCTSPQNNIPVDLVLIESGFTESPPTLPQGWLCTFKNNGTTPVDVKATVICLNPGT